MSLEDASLVSQIAAALGVIVSLIFVGFQVRQANRTMRDAAIRNHAEKFQSISRTLFEVPGLPELWDKGSKDFTCLNTVEKIKFVNFVTWMLRIYEELHVQHTKGSMDPAMWEANTRIGRDVFGLPGAQSAYEIRRHSFTPAFQAFHDKLVAGGEKKPLYESAK